MPSLVTGYEYDIFISYRQKDNKYDGWVTEFVSNLKKELEATFKEDISIYFDENPHDRLLETYDVDESLKEKLKCFIFVPIISQTYCDPKSFAWTSEFLAFKKLAGEDQVGLKVKLSNGNVANRILPVQIHHLDRHDQRLIEDELGGNLRSIEFIYEEPGVNRPLRPNDKRLENQARTDYRNQVNKLANSIKELIASVPDVGLPANTSETMKPRNKDGGQKRRISNVLFGLLTFLLLVPLYKYLHELPGFQDETSDIKSVAVLPFANLSDDSGQEYFSEGFSEEILNALSQIKGLHVPGRSSSFYFKDPSVDLKEIAERLKVNTILEGSVRRQGERIKVTVRLIDVSTGYQIWSNQFDRDVGDVFSIQEEVARSVAEKLKLTLIGKEGVAITEGLTSNMDAYDAYLRGRYFWNRRELRSSEAAYKEALQLDTAFAAAYGGLAETYVLFPTYNIESPAPSIKRAEEMAAKAIRMKCETPAPYAARMWKAIIYDWDNDLVAMNYEKGLSINPNYNILHSWYGHFLAFSEPDSIRMMHAIQRALSLDPLNIVAHNSHGLAMLRYKKFNEAIREFTTANQLNPDFSQSYVYLACTYIAQNELEMAKEVLIKAVELKNDRAYAALVYCYLKTNERSKAIALYKKLLSLNESQYTPKSTMAIAAALLGHKSLANKMLEEAFQERDPWLPRLSPQIFPASAALLSDPRNVELFELNGLPYN